MRQPELVRVVSVPFVLHFAFPERLARLRERWIGRDAVHVVSACVEGGADAVAQDGGPHALGAGEEEVKDVGCVGGREAVFASDLGGALEGGAEAEAADCLVGLGGVDRDGGGGEGALVGVGMGGGQGGSGEGDSEEGEEGEGEGGCECSCHDVLKL